MSKQDRNTRKLQGRQDLERADPHEHKPEQGRSGTPQASKGGARANQSRVRPVAQTGSDGPDVADLERQGDLFR